MWQKNCCDILFFGGLIHCLCLNSGRCRSETYWSVNSRHRHFLWENGPFSKFQNEEKKRHEKMLMHGERCLFMKAIKLTSSLACLCYILLWVYYIVPVVRCTQKWSNWAQKVLLYEIVSKAIWIFTSKPCENRKNDFKLSFVFLSHLIEFSRQKSSLMIG